MPDQAAPSKPPRPARPWFRWVFLLMLVFTTASVFVLYEWGDMKKMPGFVRIWAARGVVLFGQVRDGRESVNTLRARHILAFELESQGKRIAAIRELQSLTEISGRVSGIDHLQTLNLRSDLVTFLTKNGELSEAEEESRKRVASFKRVYGIGSHKTLMVHYELANILKLRGKREEALEVARPAIERGRKAFKAEDSIMEDFEKLYKDLQENK